MIYKLIAADEKNQQIIESHNWENEYMAESTNNKDIFRCINCGLRVYSSSYSSRMYEKTYGYKYYNTKYSAPRKIDNNMTCNEILMRDILK